MTAQLSSLLSLLTVAALLVVLGMLIRRRGPQGFVHGLGDWSRLAPRTRRRTGQVIGNVMFAMAALIAGFAGYSRLVAGDARRVGAAGLLLTIGISGLALGLVGYLRRVQKSADRDKHGR
ncbi:MAG: hypothetical protein KGJ32_02225 [Xanthomonadaceae bacterium]|nr:hypothetical protein [Xanthomonadaceae bacterium]